MCNGKLLAHKLPHFCLEWGHWNWMRVVLGGESFSALAEPARSSLTTVWRTQWEGYHRLLPVNLRSSAASNSGDGLPSLILP